MPVTPTYPGVYIEEVPSGVRTITGVSTSTTAFVGRALRGPAQEPVTVRLVPSPVIDQVTVLSIEPPVHSGAPHCTGLLNRLT